MVRRALRREPITVDADGGAPLHPVHVWDLADALALLLEAGDASGPEVHDLREDVPVTLPDLARATARHVAAVPVVVRGGDAPQPAPPAAGPPRPRADPPAGPGRRRRRRRPLAEGLVTVAQWLAYDVERTWS
jgi:nucleoside-diphosphate-sugar epimerase